MLIFEPLNLAEDKMPMENIIAAFTSPETIGTTPLSVLWLLPLAAAVAVVYKATKLPKITLANFIKEVVVAFGFGIILLVLIALALFAFVLIFI